MDRAGVCAASSWLSELEWNPVCFRNLCKMPDKAGIGERAFVTDVDCRAEAEAGVVTGVFLTVPVGEVVGRGAIEGDRHIRVERVGRDLRTAQADFLLGGEGGQEVDVR